MDWRVSAESATMKRMDSTGAQPPSVINVDESIGKTVGRRNRTSPAHVQKTGREIYRASGFRVCDPGVYRFKTHEEADAWNLQMAMKRAHRAARS